MLQGESRSNVTRSHRRLGFFPLSKGSLTLTLTRRKMIECYKLSNWFGQKQTYYGVKETLMWLKDLPIPRDIFWCFHTQKSVCCVLRDRWLTSTLLMVSAHCLSHWQDACHISLLKTGVGSLLKKLDFFWLLNDCLRCKSNRNMQMQSLAPAKIWDLEPLTDTVAAVNFH